MNRSSGDDVASTSLLMSKLQARRKQQQAQTIAKVPMTATQADLPTPPTTGSSGHSKGSRTMRDPARRPSPASPSPDKVATSSTTGRTAIQAGAEGNKRRRVAARDDYGDSEEDSQHSIGIRRRKRADERSTPIRGADQDFLQRLPSRFNPGETNFVNPDSHAEPGPSKLRRSGDTGYRRNSLSHSSGRLSHNVSIIENVLDTSIGSLRRPNAKDVSRREFELTSASTPLNGKRPLPAPRGSASRPIRIDDPESSDPNELLSEPEYEGVPYFSQLHPRQGRDLPERVAMESPSQAESNGHVQESKASRRKSRTTLRNKARARTSLSQPLPSSKSLSESVGAPLRRRAASIQPVGTPTGKAAGKKRDCLTTIRKPPPIGSDQRLSPYVPRPASPGDDPLLLRPSRRELEALWAAQQALEDEREANDTFAAMQMRRGQNHHETLTDDSIHLAEHMLALTEGNSREGKAPSLPNEADADISGEGLRAGGQLDNRGEQEPFDDSLPSSHVAASEHGFDFHDDVGDFGAFDQPNDFGYFGPGGEASSDEEDPIEEKGTESVHLPLSEAQPAEIFDGAQDETWPDDDDEDDVQGDMMADAQKVEQSDAKGADEADTREPANRQDEALREEDKDSDDADSIVSGRVAGESEDEDESYLVAYEGGAEPGSVASHSSLGEELAEESAERNDVLSNAASVQERSHGQGEEDAISVKSGITDRSIISVDDMSEEADSEDLRSGATELRNNQEQKGEDAAGDAFENIIDSAEERSLASEQDRKDAQSTHSDVSSDIVEVVAAQVHTPRKQSGLVEQNSHRSATTSDITSVKTQDFPTPLSATRMIHRMLASHHSSSPLPEPTSPARLRDTPPHIPPERSVTQLHSESMRSMMHSLHRPTPIVEVVSADAAAAARAAAILRVHHRWIHEGAVVSSAEGEDGTTWHGNVLADESVSHAADRSVLPDLLSDAESELLHLRQAFSVQTPKARTVAVAVPTPQVPGGWSWSPARPGFLTVQQASPAVRPDPVVRVSQEKVLLMQRLASNDAGVFPRVAWRALDKCFKRIVKQSGLEAGELENAATMLEARRQAVSHLKRRMVVDSFLEEYQLDSSDLQQRWSYENLLESVRALQRRWLLRLDESFPGCLTQEESRLVDRTKGTLGGWDVSTGSLLRSNVPTPLEQLQSTPWVQAEQERGQPVTPTPLLDAYPRTSARPSGNVASAASFSFTAGLSALRSRLSTVFSNVKPAERVLEGHHSPQTDVETPTHRLVPGSLPTTATDDDAAVASPTGRPPGSLYPHLPPPTPLELRLDHHEIVAPAAAMIPSETGRKISTTFSQATTSPSDESMDTSRGSELAREAAAAAAAMTQKRRGSQQSQTFVASPRSRSSISMAQRSSAFVRPPTGAGNVSSMAPPSASLSAGMSRQSSGGGGRPSASRQGSSFVRPTILAGLGDDSHAAARLTAERLARNRGGETWLSPLTKRRQEQLPRRGS